jgi:hypothetical protein
MDISRRAAGWGLLAYAVGTFVVMANAGPGGDYEPTKVAAFVAEGHKWAAFGVAYLGMFAAVGLLVFTLGAGSLLGSGRELFRGLGIAATTSAVIGWFLSGGIAVAFAEGGHPVHVGVSGPVVYTLSEVANLVAVCAPAFCLGLMAWQLAVAGELPRWLRGFGAVAGLCGILAAFFFPLPIYLLWMLVLGGTLARGRRTARVETPVLA